MPGVSPLTVDPSAGTSAPSLDVSNVCHLASLLDRCLGDASLAKRLWQRFAERLAESVGEIERLLAQDNRLDALKRIHSLKGEAASLAAHRLQHAAIELEIALKREPPDRPETESLLVALRTAAEQCQMCVPEILEALAAPVTVAT